MDTTDPPPTARRTLAPVRGPFRALAATIVPEAAGLDDEGWAGLEAIVEDALAARPAALRRQIRVLIRVLDWLPVLRWGRRFRSLAPDRRERFLARVQDAPVLLLRRGFWGLRTLVFMGFYARPAAATEIGYRADPRGWDRIRAQAEPDTERPSVDRSPSERPTMDGPAAEPKARP